MKLKYVFKHLHLIKMHRFKVFKLCCKAGIPIRGILHDLSKYSKEEFIESIKYYDGRISPIKVCKIKNGYSKAWLHHKGRNKHHFEYWIDINAPIKTPIIPYKYAIEMVCDSIAAGMVYKGKDWSPKYCLEYFNNRKDKEYINTKIRLFLEKVYNQLINDGLNKTINKKNLKKLYYNCIKGD